MLDAETKRRIDSCRDILVGKVPDPKSQVEQITIALIYKFMDDMDAEAEALGGKRSFFAGKKYAKYGWSKLMAPNMGGYDVLNLYSEAIQKMNENPGIPPLFRDIFKNAYLPYRDPETLRLFLKEINGFTYDHSERLGDAFEYLLSVLGSQGEAGQFRTPRHIIDFMVEIIDPKKNETILDPACGTAGFLISSYKHILKHNSKDYRAKESREAYEEKGVPVETLTLESPLRYKGDLLKPDERKRLAENIKGYDISPDMVRLSLVNMYLHGFTAPHIVEYDTLTSEDKWNELADIIMANPPFMSPKGGIKPHKRFSIQAKRSEVLFVDYIAEHLTPNGRAAVIVPEGIIFQSGTAYKKLREMLVKSYLVAAVSLPAGVFNPYSGVKTSILIMDKRLSKKTDLMLFVKIENDGFNLGAQRRPIDKNDLPQARAEIAEYLRRLQTGETVEDFKLSMGLIVPKEKIAANGEYNLSGERYREGVVQSSHFPWQTIEALVETVTPPIKIQKTSFQQCGRFPIIDQSQEYIAGWTNDESTLVRPNKPLVIFGDHTCAVKLIDRPFAQGADGIKILQTIDDLDPRYLYHVLKARPLESDGYQRHYSKLKEVEIPLPPLDVQKEIVADIEGYQKVIDGARVVVENYRPHIPIDPEWPISKFEEAPFEIIDGDRGVNYPKKEDFTSTGYCLFLNTKNVRPDGFNFSETEFISKEKDEALRKGKLQKGDVVLTTRGTVGNTGLYDESAPYTQIRINSGMLIFRPDHEKLLPAYLFHYFQSANFKTQKDAIVSGAAQPQLPIRSLNEVKIPIPSLATQQSIVAEIEAEQTLVNANRDLIERFEKKIQAVLARVWGEEKQA